MKELILVLVIGLSTCGGDQKDRKIKEQAAIIAEQAKRLNNLTMIVSAFSEGKVVRVADSLVYEDIGNDSIHIIYPKGQRPFAETQEK